MITTVTVGIRATCAADDVEFALRPWKTKAKRGTTIRFNLVSPARVEIYAKDAARWPFKDPSPLKLSAGSTNHLIRADAETGRFAYGVRFDCEAGGGLVEVDPDIIIIDAM